MRLTQHQVDILKRTARDVFGVDARLILFGSRVDDRLSGGDIDLYVAGFNKSVSERLDAKLQFMVTVKQQIGEQRIDLVFAPLPGQTPLPVQRIAAQTGIPL